MVGFGPDGKIQETSVIFVHDHVKAADVLVFFLNDNSFLEVTGIVN